MSKPTCRRELELEIFRGRSIEKNRKCREGIARVANVPGFRRGKAPVSLIRRKFADDIKGEVLQSLVPERVEKSGGRTEAHARSRSRKWISWTSTRASR